MNTPVRLGDTSTHCSQCHKWLSSEPWKHCDNPQCPIPWNPRTTAKLVEQMEKAVTTPAGTPTPRTNELVPRNEYGQLLAFWTDAQIEEAITAYGGNDIDCCIQNQGEYIKRLERELTALRTAHEADEQELGATMKVLGQALNPTAELTVGGVLEMAQALVERYESAQGEIAALRELLQRWLNFHTEAAGMTPEIIGEKLAFQRFMDGIDRKEADMINATKDALNATRKVK